MTGQTDEIAREQAAHDELYSRRWTRWLEEPLKWNRYLATACVPPHEGGPLYGLDIRLFVEKVASVLEELPPTATILDYGCGRAEIGILAALRGHSVVGFDLSEVSVGLARRIAARSDVESRARFVTANAQELPFADDSFDLVLGKAVLHHVIKYGGTSEELARVMKPGARGLFLEGAAVNPIIRLARWFTIKDELGDVPLTTANLRRWLRPFDRVRVTGYFLLYMLKRFGFRSYREDDWQRGRNRLGRTKIFDQFLKGCLALDELIVNGRPWARRLAGRFLIEVER